MISHTMITSPGPAAQPAPCCAAVPVGPNSEAPSTAQPDVGAGQPVGSPHPLPAPVAAPASDVSTLPGPDLAQLSVLRT
jgi:hypothetical protein